MIICTATDRITGQLVRNIDHQFRRGPRCGRADTKTADVKAMTPLSLR
jgi:hypothetical protein